MTKYLRIFFSKICIFCKKRFSFW